MEPQEHQQLGRIEAKLCSVHTDIRELKDSFKEHVGQDQKDFQRLFTFNTRVKQTGSVLFVILIGLWTLVKFAVPLTLWSTNSKYRV